MASEMATGIRCPSTSSKVLLRVLSGGENRRLGRSGGHGVSEEEDGCRRSLKVDVESECKDLLLSRCSSTAGQCSARYG